MTNNALTRPYLTSFRDYPYEPLALEADVRGSPITPIVVNTLLDGLRRGLSRPAAAARAGIPIGTLESMIGRGIRVATQRPDVLRTYDWESYQLFVEVGRAEGELELQQVEKWLVNGANDWAAQRDFLARRFPDTWSATAKVDMSIKKMENHDLIQLIQSLMADMTPTDGTALLEAEQVADVADSQSTEATPRATRRSFS